MIPLENGKLKAMSCAVSKVKYSYGSTNYTTINRKPDNLESGNTLSISL